MRLRPSSDALKARAARGDPTPPRDPRRKGARIFPLWRASLSAMLRFAIVYSLVMWAALHTPLFQQLERPLVAAVDLALARFDRPGVSRSLELRPALPEWHYRLHVEHRGVAERIERTYHPHAYIWLLLSAAVLATPHLGLRRRLASLAIAGSLAFLFAAGLLSADVYRWEHAAFELEQGGFGLWFAQAFDLLHRSAAAGILPILLWLLYAGEVWQRRQA